MDANSSPSLSAEEQISTQSSREYWSNIPATVNGMLGGYPQISRIDLRGSQVFVAKLRRAAASSPAPKDPPLLARGVDCGAGIGRVTAGLMSHVCAVVDIVEPIARFADQAAALPTSELGKGRIGTVFISGLEDWKPSTESRYDLMWHQWCLGHLNNALLEAYLRSCQQALLPGGWIVAKENISTTQDVYDDVDSSVTRTDESYRAAFANAGLKIVRTELQHGFPRHLGLYPVRFYALQPAE
jgi:protein N-terminal methyltransferase